MNLLESVLKNAARESIFLTVMSKIRNGYLRVISYMEYAYRNSAVCKMRRAIVDRIKISIRESRVSRMFNIKENILAIDDSALINYAACLCRWSKERIGKLTMTSNIIRRFRLVRNDIDINPVRSVGYIIMVTTITNIAISLFLSKEAGFRSWFIRVNFLILGIVWASSKAGLDELKKTSLWLMLIKRR